MYGYSVAMCWLCSGYWLLAGYLLVMHWLCVGYVLFIVIYLYVLYV